VHLTGPGRLAPALSFRQQSCRGPARHRANNRTAVPGDRHIAGSCRPRTGRPAPASSMTGPGPCRGRRRRTSCPRSASGLPGGGPLPRGPVRH